MFAALPKVPVPWNRSKGWASHESSMGSFVAIFTAVSRFLAQNRLVPPVYQQLDSSRQVPPAVAQPECRDCPILGAFVHPLGSRRPALPIETSVDGAFAFPPSGSRYPQMRRASVAALKHRREPRRDAPDHRTTQEQL